MITPPFTRARAQGGEGEHGDVLPGGSTLSVTTISASSTIITGS